MPKEFDLKELNESGEFQRVIDSMRSGGEYYILKINGKPQAALLSLKDIALLDDAKAQKKKSWTRLLQLMSQVHNKNASIPGKEVDTEVDAAIREVRAARYNNAPC